MPDSKDFDFADEGGWTLGRFAALKSGGLVHAVTTRCGLDVGRVKLEPAWAAGRLAERLGLQQAAWLDQIHGGDVLSVLSGGLAGQGDGLVTARRGLGLVGRSADCPLILLADEASGVAGMAHASWRGTVRMIAARLVEAAANLGGSRERMIACICPSAGPCCYEVGRDVLEAAVGGIGPEARNFFVPRGDKFVLDLWSANRRQLELAGIEPGNIHIAGVCTLCRNDIFPSHRKEGASAGRFMAVIGLAVRADKGGVAWRP